MPEDFTSCPRKGHQASQAGRSTDCFLLVHETYTYTVLQNVFLVFFLNTETEWVYV